MFFARWGRLFFIFCSQSVCVIAYTICGFVFLALDQKKHVAKEAKRCCFLFFGANIFFFIPAAVCRWVFSVP